MKILLFSNSTNAGEEYFSFPMPYIDKHFPEKPQHGLFIPYAGVTITYDEYFEKVQTNLNGIGIGVQSIHLMENKQEAIENADLIVIGGGNSFQLLKLLQQENLLIPIREKVLSGTPYIGWSAGSNVCCPTIKTTNDMPIVEPETFHALNLVPFQINPHYTDTNPVGHAGETREMRIEEFIEVNRDTTVVGLREGTLLHISDNAITLEGKKNVRIFKYGHSPMELGTSDDLSFLFS